MFDKGDVVWVLDTESDYCYSVGTVFLSDLDSTQVEFADHNSVWFDNEQLELLYGAAEEVQEDTNAEEGGAARHEQTLLHSS